MIKRRSGRGSGWSESREDETKKIIVIIKYDQYPERMKQKGRTAIEINTAVSKLIEKEKKKKRKKKKDEDEDEYV